MRMIKKPTLADATAAVPLMHSASREASPHRHFVRHTEVRRGYLRQTSHLDGSADASSDAKGGSPGGGSTMGERDAASLSLQSSQQQQQRQQQHQQQQTIQNKIRRGLLQYIHRANLYYHGTLDTKDAVISLLNVANFALDPNAVLIKSSTSDGARPGAAFSDAGDSISRPTRGMQLRRGSGLQDRSPSSSRHHTQPFHSQQRQQQQQQQQQQPSPLTPRLSRAGTHQGTTQSPLQGQLSSASSLVLVDHAQGLSPMPAGGRASLLPTPHASPSISSAGKQRQAEAIQRTGRAATDDGGDVVVAEDETTGTMMPTTDDGCDLEDWLLEAVYNLLEHEAYKGQAMTEALSEYIVHVALARERRYRSLRSQLEQHQQHHHQHQQQQQPQQQQQQQDEEEELQRHDQYRKARGYQYQDQEEDEHGQVLVEGHRFPDEEGAHVYEDVERHMEEEEVVEEEAQSDQPFEAQGAEVESGHAQKPEVEEDEAEDEYRPRDVHLSDQGASHSLSSDRPLAYSLYHHARFRWSGGADNSSDIGDVPTSDIAVPPSELTSELATDVQPSEPPTELGEPIKLVMQSEDCFGAGSGSGGGGGGLVDEGSIGNDSFRRLRSPVEDAEDDEDDDNNDDHGGGDHEEDDILAAAIGHTGVSARQMDRRTMMLKEAEELAEQPPSDLPSEMHEISRIDLASDLEPLIQEFAEDNDLEGFLPMDRAAVLDDDDDEEEQECRPQGHGLLLLMSSENVAPSPSEDWV
ncbi:hypothetical protein DFQ26_000429 [Actinomortierella ambigua]|nr:hypothetical protein DFQ26_000429 [Actinomortierella ambigua]